jgi:hypothetical protein
VGKHEAAGTSAIGLKHPLFQAVWDEDVEALVAIVDEDTDLLDRREQVRVEPISPTLLFLMGSLSLRAPRILEPALLSPCTHTVSVAARGRVGMVRVSPASSLHSVGCVIIEKISALLGVCLSAVATRCVCVTGLTNRLHYLLTQYTGNTAVLWASAWGRGTALGWLINAG